MTWTSLAWAAPGAPGEGVPQPEGWIGTTEQWAQRLGIALALLKSRRPHPRVAALTTR